MSKQNISHQDMVREFMILCNQLNSNTFSPSIDLLNPSEKDTKIIKLRLILLIEKVLELVQSVLQNNSQFRMAEPLFNLILNNIESLKVDDFDLRLEEIAKILSDMEYINLGTSLLLGIKSDVVFRLVHNNNLTKIDPITGKIHKRNNDNKVIGHDNYKSLNLKDYKSMWFIDN